MRLPGKKQVLIPLAMLALVLVSVVLYYPGLENNIAATAYNKGLNAFYFPLLGLFRDVIFTVSFWVVILLTLCLQMLIPAKPNQKVFSLSFGQDLVWFFYATILHAVILVTYVDLLMRFYGKFFSSLTITPLAGTPGWLRFVAALLLLDFLYWAQHYFIHKVPLLWQFHKLHHSQEELNFFTDFRYHVLEYVVRNTFLVIPFLILQVEVPVIASLAIFLTWYSRFYHGNIRTNLGPLRYILVTPQSHRIHHSIDAEHRDTNYGAIFSIWDWMFGTQCKRSDVYPDTGIDDNLFPHEERAGLRSLLVTPLRQMVYPFAAIANGRRPGSSPETEEAETDRADVAPLWAHRQPTSSSRLNLEFGDRIEEVNTD